MHIVPPVDPVHPTSPDNKKGQQKSILSKINIPLDKPILKDVVDIFDNYYTTQLSSLLIKDENPQGAYDHIRHSSLNDEYIKMDGYTIIYSWLCEKLSPANTVSLQKGFTGRVKQVIDKLIFTDPKVQYQTLLLKLEKEISEWFAETMSKGRYHEIGKALPIPTSYFAFPGKVPAFTSLGVRLNKILKDAMPDDLSESNKKS